MPEGVSSAVAFPFCTLVSWFKLYLLGMLCSEILQYINASPPFAWRHETSIIC
jgi:hypothetical protein